MASGREAVAVARLLSFISPTPAELEFLRTIPGEGRSVAAGESIHPGIGAEGFFLLLDGWAANSIVSEDGSERISSINLPGDLLGMTSFVLANPVDRTYALTCAALRWIPASILREMFERHPRLAATMLLVAQEERAVKNEWISLHAVPARSRLAAFLFRIGERLQKLREILEGNLSVPLTQRQLAEIVGVTPVYIHKLIHLFRQDGLIRYKRGCIDIEDMQRLQEIAGLDKWQLTTPAWLPKPTA